MWLLRRTECLFFIFTPMSQLDTCIILAHIKSLVKMNNFGGLE